MRSADVSYCRRDLMPQGCAWVEVHLDQIFYGVLAMLVVWLLWRALRWDDRS